jgi:hypothetical protein
VDFRNFTHRSTKAFIKPNSDFLAYRLDNTWFIRRFLANPDYYYPEWNTQIQVYGDVKRNVFELEAVSPDFIIPAGQAVSWTESMSLFPDTDIKDLKKEAAKIPSLLQQAPIHGTLPALPRF